jgi:serine/threonine-protein kinase
MSSGSTGGGAAAPAPAPADSPPPVTESPEQALARHQVTLAPDTATHASEQPRQTMGATARSGVASAGLAYDTLKRMGAVLAPDPRRLALGSKLGAGGMGLVQSAEQVALGREVAVKTVKPEVKTALAELELLREAWVTGVVEHPNVVPLYELFLDPEKGPLLVMKRITGQSWTSLMADAERVKARFGAGDLLEWNLGILITVSHAVHFAHVRGIVHRDLKPGNVMIGEHGEVYVLDWGLAVALRDDGTGRLPLNTECRDMAGTPAYMAPEMLGGRRPPATPQTDVYLLGAILHEIVSGDPPHRGRNLGELLDSIAASRPRLPPDCSPELQRIISRAMSVEAAQRHADVDELRRELQLFLEHRHAERMALEATSRLAELRDLLAPPAPGALAPAAARLYDRFGECRFGFQQALRQWPDCIMAREGLGQAVKLMCEHELGAGQPEAAARLLSDLPEPSPQLAARVQAAVEKEAARERERERQLAALDPALGRRQRQILAVVACVFFILVPVEALLRAGRGTTYERLLATGAVGVTVILLIAGWARRVLPDTLINRGIVMTAVMSQLSFATAHVGSLLLGIPAERAEVLPLFAFFAVVGTFALCLELRMIVGAAGYLAAFLVSSRWPELRYLSLVAANLVTLLVMLLIWRRPRPERGRVSPP